MHTWIANFIARAEESHRTATDLEALPEPDYEEMTYEPPNREGPHTMRETQEMEAING